MFHWQVAFTRDRGQHYERLSIDVRRRNETICETGWLRKVTTGLGDEKAQLASPRRVGRATRE